MRAWELLATWLDLLSPTLLGHGPRSPCCSAPVSHSLCCFYLLPDELKLVSEGEGHWCKWEILSSWESRGLFLKPSLASAFPALRGQAKHLSRPRAMQKFACDAGTRRMHSDLKVLSGDPAPKAVCANLRMSAWGGLGPKDKRMWFVLQGKLIVTRSPSGSCVQAHEGCMGIELCLTWTEFGVNHRNVILESWCL